ncbi:hypothetical protein [Leptospira jelokensis]|uniref:hypothetical protein n=1 Tax=Leptospira jelokensis TaxID=2484931 RepID=UPI001090B8DC|nr:hypothetical protein [Leptospira jelokensis]TGM01183.1 hypothetical protein EHQ79_06925 [Leptospira jelokensis]
MIRFYLLMVCLLCAMIYCKRTEKVNESSINEDNFYMEGEKGCIKEKSFDETAQGCIENKEDLLCYKYLNHLKNSKLDKIFYAESWESNDTQSFIYVIDKAGNINVMRGGPDKNKNEFELSGHGKLQQRNEKWYYQHACDKKFCDQLDFDIEYVSCFAGYSKNFNGYALILMMENSDWFGDDKSLRNQYKEITYVKILNQLPQITNGFTSTKVPPIPSN